MSNYQSFDAVDQEAVTTLRMLAIDEIASAKSGHPGIALGAAPMLYTLYSRFLTADPTNPTWFNRDRFVLSAGHGSALLYAMLHLSQYDLTLRDLKQFRQAGSKTPGHPEVGITPGVDAGTGPLGQGLGMAVGMAMAETHLAADKMLANCVDHYTYALVGDGDLMEGISHEAASFAGVNHLNKLIVLYDSNDVTLDGPLSRSSADQVEQRFGSYGWQYLRVDDGEDLTAIADAIELAQQSENRPTIIEVRTTIGFGASKAGTNAVHGAAILGDDLVALKSFYKWPTDESFVVPTQVYQRLRETFKQRGSQCAQIWSDYVDQQDLPAQEMNVVLSGQQTKPQQKFNWNQLMAKMGTQQKMSTRQAGNLIVQAASEQSKYLWGGAADLASSTKTDIKEAHFYGPNKREGSNIAFGIREFAQAAIMNGIALHGGQTVYGSGFLTFSDYFKGAARLAALQKLPVTYVLTHDSIAVGEDGPTHQPIEQIAGLRALPNMTVIRPADGREAIEAWDVALQRQDGPTAIIESRQDLRILPGTGSGGVKHGAYTISPARTHQPDGLLIATGSEVSLAIDAQELLRHQGVDIAVISMPSMEIFDQQSVAYRESVLPSHIRNRMSLEAGTTFGWGKYLGLEGYAYGIDTFGESGPADAVQVKYGFTAKQVAEKFETLFKVNQWYGIKAQ